MPIFWCGICDNLEKRMANKSEIEQAARIVREGGLVVLPTETVYGLGTNALDASAVRKIYALKGRPATSPLIVHVASIEQAKELAAEGLPEAERLARQYWPGPLTIVVPKKSAIPDEVTAGLPTVGLRMPRHPVGLELLRAAGVPIAAPSANRLKQLSPTTAERVLEEYAAELYSALHKFDRQEFDWIAVELPPDVPEWAAIRDRLMRAAH